MVVRKERRRGQGEAEEDRSSCFVLDAVAEESQIMRETGYKILMETLHLCGTSSGQMDSRGNYSMSFKRATHMGYYFWNLPCEDPACGKPPLNTCWCLGVSTLKRRASAMQNTLLWVDGGSFLFCPDICCTKNPGILIQAISHCVWISTELFWTNTDGG